MTMIRTDFMLSMDHPSTIDPDQVKAVLGKRVVRLYADTGTLILEFDNGTRLKIKSATPTPLLIEVEKETIEEK